MVPIDMPMASSSPVCVIQAACHHQYGPGGHSYPPAAPDLYNVAFAKQKSHSHKRVRVSESTPSVIPASVLCSEEEIRGLWLSKAELRRNCAEAKRDIGQIQQDDPEYLQSFLGAFQVCSAKKVRISFLLKDENVQRLMKGQRNIRGLEAKAHKVLSQYRKWHVQNLIEAQARYSSSEINSRDMLRSVSLQTSSTSRTLGRLLGLLDEFHLNQLLQQEIDR